MGVSAMERDDIQDRARDLTCQYGDGASLQAAMKADEAMERIDLDAHRLWLAVMERIERLDLDRNSTMQ